MKSDAVRRLFLQGAICAFTEVPLEPGKHELFVKGYMFGCFITSALNKYLELLVSLHTSDEDEDTL